MSQTQDESLGSSTAVRSGGGNLDQYLASGDRDIRMKQKTLVPGTLVRCGEKPRLWRLPIVLKKKKNEYEVQYLDGSRERAAAWTVYPFLDWLQRRPRTLSIRREDLFYRLYGMRRSRLRPEWIKQMQKFLRKHGLRYSPADWDPETRISIMPDESFVDVKQAGDKDGLEYRMLLPRWLAPHKLPAGSRDPLGFQSSAEALADEFLPGLTVFTSRIGYYGLITWAVRELNSNTIELPRGTTRREQFHRIERTLALCEFIHHGRDDKECRLLGQRSKSEVLQSATGNRFHVPGRILRNQEATGALRLYSTSMVSNGFVLSRPELVADGLLPFELTDLGSRLAREFEKRLPDGFLRFALSDKSKDREELRQWGERICFAGLGYYKYREPLLEGLLLGNSLAAAARYRTVCLLFRHRFLSDGYNQGVRRSRDTLSEEDVAAEDAAPDTERLSNAQVLLKFYSESTIPENRALQTAAVFELLSLAHTAIFVHAMRAIQEEGRVKVNTLLQGIIASGRFGQLWTLPFMDAGKKTRRVGELVEELWVAQDEENTPKLAAVGGALLARVANEEPYRSLQQDLENLPVLTLLQQVQGASSLANTFGQVLDAMVLRHGEVSTRKSRQRWCHLEGDELVREDVQPLAIGWHSMRFPQLYSLCRDLNLTKGDLKHGE